MGPAPLRGLLGTKIGMTQVFLDDNRMVPATVVQSEGLVVTDIKTKEKHGYQAVQVGMGDVSEKKLTQPRIGVFRKKGLPLKRWLHEFRVNDVTPFLVGQRVPVTVFSQGEWVQVSGMTKGKGFAGAMKRHNFSGLPHSHGHGEYRRAPGSSGGQGPQHVLPGTKKPGHMGHVWSTAPKVEVVGIIEEKDLVLIRGSIPGPNGNHVVIRPTSKRVKVGKPQQSKKKGKK